MTRTAVDTVTGLYVRRAGPVRVCSYDGRSWWAEHLTAGRWHRYPTGDGEVATEGRFVLRDLEPRAVDQWGVRVG